MKKIIIWILIAPILLIMGLYLLGSIITEAIDPLPNPPSKEIKQLLKNEKFYFMYGGGIYESIGYQRIAKPIKEYYKLDDVAVGYYLPIKSFNQENLAFFEVHVDSEYGTQPINSQRIISIKVNIINLVNGNEKSIFDFYSTGENELPILSLHDCEDNEKGNYHLKWINDNELIFRFLEKAYLYNLETNIIGEYKEELVEDNIDEIDNCFFFAYQGWRSTWKNSLSYKQFDFYKVDREGLNSAYYVVGVDRNTNETFRLTIFKRAIYTE